MWEVLGLAGGDESQGKTARSWGGSKGLCSEQPEDLPGGSPPPPGSSTFHFPSSAVYGPILSVLSETHLWQASGKGGKQGHGWGTPFPTSLGQAAQSRTPGIQRRWKTARYMNGKPKVENVKMKPEFVRNSPNYLGTRPWVRSWAQHGQQRLAPAEQGMLLRFCKLKEKSRAGSSPSKPGWLQGAVGSAGRAGGRCSTGQLDNSLVITVFISVLSQYYLIVLVQPLAPGSCATRLMAWKRGEVWGF